MALKGAEIIFYPTAIGINENLPEVQTSKPWRKAIVSNGIHNNMFVAAPNRVGQEKASDGTGSMLFYGTSFIADPWGEIVEEAKTTQDEIIMAEIDLSEVRRARDILQFHRDRRPDSYHELLEISLK
jgi:N-carbamoylputrescine amidase